jgi:hypothetical protein
MLPIPIDLKSVLGGNRVDPPKTGIGKFIGSFSGRNRNARMQAQSSGTPTPNLPVQNRPLASGSIQFGTEQRNRNLFGIGVMVVAVVGLISYFRAPKKRRR